MSRPGPRVLPNLPETETGFQGAVIDLAHLMGWTVAHFRPAMTAHGWRTPVQADGKGWPDLFLVRPPRLVVAELKRDAPTAHAREKQLSDDQRVWLRLFEGCAAVEVHVWRPADWPDIERVLGHH